MKEFKSLDVANAEESAWITLYQNFGWIHKSSQRVFAKDTHLERRDCSVVQVTETTDFTKIVFERDQETKNYSQLVALEQEFFSLTARIPDQPPRYYDKCATIEEWATAAKPVLLKTGMGIITVLLTIILSGIVIGYDTLINHVKITLSSVLMILFPCLIVSILIAYIYDSIRSRAAVRQALSDPNSKFRPELDRKYLQLLNEIDDYNALVAQREQVFTTATLLVKSDSNAKGYITE